MASAKVVRKNGRVVLMIINAEMIMDKEDYSRIKRNAANERGLFRNHWDDVGVNIFLKDLIMEPYTAGCCRNDHSSISGWALRSMASGGVIRKAMVVAKDQDLEGNWRCGVCNRVINED
jgi:hypothetical protein